MDSILKGIYTSSVGSLLLSGMASTCFLIPQVILTAIPVLGRVYWGMIRFNASDPENLSWTNETLGNGSHGVEVPNTQGGAMAYIPAGKQGMLVSFGGGNITAGVSETTGYPKTGADWQIIHVYDIASHTWWKQQASGDAPKRTRIGFGTAVSISPDGSAFHITTYGGWGPSEGRAFEDVYVLSIPSFLWINATSTTYETNSEQQANWTMGRNGLSGSCNTYKGSQMIVLGGGIFEGNRSLIDGECRDELPPVKVLDLSTYQWRDDLDSNAVYEVPPIIYNEIGGNSTGGAFATVPAAGFADPTLASALQERVATSTSTPLPGDPAAQDQEDTNPETESGTSNTGAIAGGVVGGVLGLALLIAIFWLFRRHQKKTQQLSVGELPASTSSDHKSEIGELGGRETVAELGGPPHLMRAELQGDRTQVHEMPP